VDAAQVLVAILATALALFLVLGIILVVYLIKIAQQIQRVTGSVERTTANIEQVVGNVQKFVAPAVLSRFVLEQIQKFTNRHKSHKSRGEE